MQETGICLITGTNESFWPKAENYVNSINSNSNVTNIVVTLDFDVSQKDREKYNNVKFIRIEHTQVKSPNLNFCLQHGGFLPGLNFLNQDDTIIFTDADIILQRPFSKDDIVFIRNIGQGEIGVNFNRSDSDFLIEEAERLKPSLTVNEIEKKYNEIRSFPTYNTGVIIAKYRTYLQLYEMYNKYWPEFENIFKKSAKQQWLLSYLIGKYFKPVIIPDLIHTHGKYPVNLRVKKKMGFKFFIENELVALNHYIQHPAELQVDMEKRKIRYLHKQIKKLTLALILVTLLLIILILKNIIY